MTTEEFINSIRLDGEELVVPEEDEFEKVSAYYQNELVGE